ncbi:unnamed protein product, partial [Trichogramma brassicae]
MRTRSHLRDDKLHRTAQQHSACCRRSRRANYMCTRTLYPRAASTIILPVRTDTRTLSLSRDYFIYRALTLRARAAE